MTVRYRPMVHKHESSQSRCPSDSRSNVCISRNSVEAEQHRQAQPRPAASQAHRTSTSVPSCRPVRWMKASPGQRAPLLLSIFMLRRCSSRRLSARQRAAKDSCQVGRVDDSSAYDRSTWSRRRALPSGTSCQRLPGSHGRWTAPTSAIGFRCEKFVC